MTNSVRNFQLILTHLKKNKIDHYLQGEYDAIYFAHIDDLDPNSKVGQQILEFDGHVDEESDCWYIHASA